MGSSVQFKHVNGRNGKVESICMYCLLAVGICCSDEELLARESSHPCRRNAEPIASRKLQIAPPVHIRDGLDRKQICGNPLATQANRLRRVIGINFAFGGK